MHTNYRFWRFSLVIGVGLAMIVGFAPAAIELWDQFLQGDKSAEIATQPQSMVVLPTPTAIPTAIPPTEITLSDVMTDSRTGKNIGSGVYPQQDTTTIFLGGDVMLGRSVGFNMTRKQDFAYPFSEIATQFKTADLAIVNLENPVIENCPLTSEGMIFCSTPASTSTLLSAGIDLVNLANNHTLNYGVQGLEETGEHLKAAGIVYTGTADNPVVSYNIRNISVGVVGFSMFGGQSINQATADAITSYIPEAQNSHDIVLASFHWGEEYKDQPGIGQRLLAYQAIDAGADAVFGHHSHWVQGMELYNGKPIFYSLGNLVFDQDWSRETRTGIVIELGYYKHDLATILIKPVFMANFAQPRWETVGYGNTTLARFESLSTALQESQTKILQLH